MPAAQVDDEEEPVEETADEPEAPEQADAPEDGSEPITVDDVADVEDEFRGELEEQVRRVNELNNETTQLDNEVGNLQGEVDLLKGETEEDEQAIQQMIESDEFPDINSRQDVDEIKSDKEEELREKTQELREKRQEIQNIKAEMQKQSGKVNLLSRLKESGKSDDE